MSGALAADGPREGRLAIVLWLPRLYAQAWSPVVAAAGAVLGCVALGFGRRTLGLLGLGGAGLAARHIAVALGGSPAPRLPQASGRRLADVRVGCLEDGEVVLGDLWCPDPDQPRSGIGIVYLHGGLWKALDKGFCIAPLMRILTARGHDVLDTAYPLAPGARLEAMDEAVGLAVQWLSVHGAAEGVRADRVVLVGHAGGGHLALVHAFRRSLAPADGAGEPPIRGVVGASRL